MIRPVIHATVAKTFRFEASHQLPNHSGKCRNLHGHSYRVRVAVNGPINQPTGESDDGMVIDFNEISTIWKRDLEPNLDHKHLNDSLDELLAGRPPTAEVLALIIHGTFRGRLAGKAPLGSISVTVWETQTSSATVHLA